MFRRRYDSNFNNARDVASAHEGGGNLRFL
jgi:hypothetical protein